MGFFDKLQNIGKALQSNIPNDIKNSIDNIAKDVNTDIYNAINTNKADIKDMSPIYNKFPQFDGKLASLYEKDTPKYMRCTMDYRSVSSLDFEDYIYQITEAGFIQESNIRYEKENTYIIVEYSNRMLHLVFHIKK